MKGKWAAKAVIQKAISFLPNSQGVNYLFQHYVTGSTTLADEFLNKRIEWAGMHLSALREFGDANGSFVAVELGSGWYPIVPLCYFLAGADSVWMVDLEDLTRPELTAQAIEGLIAAHDAGTGALAPLGDGIDEARVDRLRGALKLVRDGQQSSGLETLGIRAKPVDARLLELPDPPNLISSNTVFEHIPAEILEGVLRRFAEISTSGTVMSHLVDHCDHYAYIDDQVSVYHFLRYSDRQWKWIDNSVQPMNRLRASEYVAMYERAGIPLTREFHRGCDPLELVGEPLAQRFKSMDPADVACKASHLVTRFG